MAPRREAEALGAAAGPAELAVHVHRRVRGPQVEAQRPRVRAVLVVFLDAGLAVVGLAVIFVYAFYKFAWSYRLFNYAAILLGAVPGAGQGDRREAEAAAEPAGRMNVVAGRHFNRGQRAFFFALAYLGWFISAYVLLVSTAACLFVMWRRQIASDAVAALGESDK